MTEKKRGVPKFYVEVGNNVVDNCVVIVVLLLVQGNMTMEEKYSKIAFGDWFWNICWSVLQQRDEKYNHCIVIVCRRVYKNAFLVTLTSNNCFPFFSTCAVRPWFLSNFMISRSTGSNYPIGCDDWVCEHQKMWHTYMAVFFDWVDSEAFKRP